jgi:hypothetical protein
MYEHKTLTFEFDIQRTVLGDTILVIKAKKMHYFSTLFW